MRTALAAWLVVVLAGLLACGAPASPRGMDTRVGPSTAPDAPPLVSLRAPADFAGIADPGARSVALFLEASRVIVHPRCMNCHPSDRVPTQGDDRHAHVPPMEGGADGHGPTALACSTCHSPANVRSLGEPIASIPGHPQWGLAPASMAWQGKTVSEICVQLKDPARNGGKTLAAIHEHLAHDTLVGWAWQPGEGRAPAPGTQAQLGRLIEAWIATGARCP